MKRLLMTATALAMLTATAHAVETKTLHQGPYWRAYSLAQTKETVPMCGMSTGPGDDGRMFIVKWTPNNGMWLEAVNFKWRLPNNAKANLKVLFVDDDRSEVNTFSGADAWTTSANHGGSISLRVNDKDIAWVLDTFGGAERMAVSFPDGDEPDWQFNMGGSRKAASFFANCVIALKEASTSPIAKPTQPTSPVKQTSPVSKRNDVGV